jgi:hypothetical protein
VSSYSFLNAQCTPINHFENHSRVNVAKLAPNKPLKPIDMVNNAGIKTNKNGDFIPYSILGNFDDYFQELRCRHELPVSYYFPSPEFFDTIDLDFGVCRTIQM